MASFRDVLADINSYSHRPDGKQAENESLEKESLSPNQQQNEGGTIPVMNVENLLANYLHSNALDLKLTLAERVLLLEGSQTGKADCTIPPYVEFEQDLFTYSEKTIRSEIVEWALSGGVSRLLFKSGGIRITGANFLTSGDYNGHKYIDHQRLVKASNRFSLNLSSREIVLDLEFDDCKFYSGIDISNSYCENLIFRNCRFGSTRYDDSNLKQISINGDNSHIRGNFIIGKPAEFPHEVDIQPEGNEKWSIIASNVTFEAAKIEGRFEISGHANSKARENSITVNGCVNLRHAVINGEVAFNAVSVRGTVIDNVLTAIEGHNLKCRILNFDPWSHLGGQVNLTFARPDLLFANFSFFGGSPYSIVASGITSRAVLIRNCTVAHGIQLFKSVVAGDIDLSGSIVGCERSMDKEKMSVILSNSSAKNINLNNRFTSYGCVMLDKAKVVGTVSLSNSNFLGLCPKSKDDGDRSAKISAINAQHIYVGNELTFNETRLPSSGHLYNAIEKVGLEWVYLAEVLKENFHDFKNSVFLKEIEVVLNKLDTNPLGLLTAYDAATLAEQKDFLQKERTEYQNALNILATVAGQLSGDIARDLDEALAMGRYRMACLDRNLDIYQEVNHVDSTRLTWVVGEADFRSATINGKMDCAGAYFRGDAYGLFYKDLLQPKIKRGTKRYLQWCWRFIWHKRAKVDNWVNAINLRFATINGSFFANRGHWEKQIPFIAQGNIDLQNAKIDKMFITISKRRTKFMRWKLIGAQYTYLTDDFHYLSKNKNKGTLKKYLETWIRRFRFNAGCWIFSCNSQHNFRQPFEQFGNYLINSGEDSLGRNLLVLWRPTRWWLETAIMLPVRIVYFFGHTVSLCVLSLFFLWSIGGCLYDTHRWSISETDNHIAGFDFNPYAYSAERLIPLYKGDQNEQFTVLQTTAGDAFFEMYHSFIHPILGLIYVSLLLVNIARLRKGGS